MEFQTQLYIQAFAAFFGAFFAYLFTRIALFFEKIYDRQVKHFNSLVRLQNQLNEIGGIIDDNLFIIPKFREVLLSGNVYYNNLLNIPVDRTHFDDLHDLELINLLFSYQHQIRKINDDMDALSQAHQMLTHGLFSKGITHEEYEANVIHLANQLQVAEAFQTQLLEETMTLIARVRVEMEIDLPLGLRLQRQFIKTAGDQKKITKQMLGDERKKLNKELKQSKTSSRKEIEKVLKRNGLL